MPQLILGTNAHTRIVVTERTPEFYFEFYAPMARGEPLTAELIALTPDPYYVEPPSRGDMPDIFGKNLGVWTVNEKVKSIIESVEPNVHTFIPVNLRVRGKDKDYGKFYLLHIGQAIDAVVIEETGFFSGFGREGFEKSPTLTPPGGAPPALDRDLISGRHLWRGGRGKLGGGGDPFYSYFFCSDELKKRLKVAKVDGWRFRECIFSKARRIMGKTGREKWT